jgi:DNA (cytosine-5)-methyltransferase 3A
MKIKVLSLFDGISVAQQALKELGYDVEYYASEIDKYAIQITQKNHPDTYQVGDVKQIGLDTNVPTQVGVVPTRFYNIDLLIGGSPCQDLSIAKKNRQGLDGARSGLFWEYVRILKEVKPKYFVLENVNSMPKEAKAIITEALGVEPIMINAALVSAQNRKRLFWTNIPNVTQPEDREILLKDILEENVNEKYNVPNYNTSWSSDKPIDETKDKYKVLRVGGDVPTVRLGQIGKGGQGDRIYSPEGKSVGLSALGGGRGAKTGLDAISKPVILGDEPLQVLKEGRTELGKQSRKEIREKTGKDSTSRSAGYKAYYGREGIKANCITTGLGAEGMVVENSIIRKLTPIECERLQSLPDNYTEGISNSQRYKCLGNAFNCAVVKHILSNIK